MRIFNYPVNEGMNILRVPSGAQVVSVGLRGHHPHVWVMVTPDAPETELRLYGAMTGQDLPPGFGVYHGRITIDWLQLHILGEG